jgi:Holliday junction resolvase RusA-like endonuclease
MIVNIKPLSVNEAWQGKRFKTKKYLSYEKTLLLTLPKNLVIPEGKLALMIVFGLSSKNADVDNGLKPILDILQKAYGFNDKRIYLLRVAKVDVAKGKEYISINFHKY